MITKEYGKHFGVCDYCDEATPIFDSWNECRAYIRSEGWKTQKDKETGEWEDICPACARKIRRMNTLQDFDKL